MNSKVVRDLFCFWRRTKWLKKQVGRFQKIRGQLTTSAEYLVSLLFSVHDKMPRECLNSLARRRPRKVLASGLESEDRIFKIQNGHHE